MQTLDYQGKNFNNFLTKKKISKVEAAKMLGISRSAIYDYFNSKNLSRETVQKITSAFNTTEEEVFNSKNNETILHELEKFRLKKGFTYSELADIINLDENTLKNVISGVRQLQEGEANKIYKELGISLTQYQPNLSLNIVEENSLPHEKGGVSINNQPNAIPFAGDFDTLNMYVVPVKAYGGFLSGYENPVFMESLTKSSFPFIKGKCFAFEVDGFSMYRDFVPGDWVITTLVENFNWLSKGKVYVFQTIDGIIIKCFDKIEGEYIHLYSLNDEFNPVEPIHLKDVKKVYFKEKVLKN
ncbi:helix-turn-helix domain-containing protein [Pedobacter cryoconitis]|uniref:Helix-turn-helix protein n=1 Tax=Pedobacter cryoconitis TaxID=188932 RepID=A0A327S6J4_9SPHI|nr:helix-turn-helix domain-containing protein [Pedobacter cryoconitis]RAJ24295.1 helix-turn-helix protein [Pedobacter cryoconitis]